MNRATLNGVTAPRVRVQVPAWGLWWADVDLDAPEVLTGIATLVLADATLVGTIVSGDVLHGRAAYRIVGGAGGWGRVVSEKAYLDDAGVKAKSVAGDLASAVGETLAGVPATRLGPHYARPMGVASLVLSELFPRAWRIDFDGVTRIGLRESVVYDGAATRIRTDKRLGVVELAVDSLAGLLPGAIVDGMPPAVDVEYSLDPKRLTARVYGGTTVSRRVAALGRILDALDPRRRYRATYEFRVVSQSGERVNLQPVRASSGMPTLSNVPVRPGMAGLKASYLLGSLVLVAFVDADPSRPAVVAHDAPDAPGWMPLGLQLGEAPVLGVARQTDATQSGELYAQLVPSGPAIGAVLAIWWSPEPEGGLRSWTVVASGAIPPVPATPGTAIEGTITGGSSRITAGL